MVEAKFFRDYNHNYIILKCENMDEAGDTYRFKMLESNKIDRLLKCSIRNVNGKAYFYYDISSKATLKNFYQSKKMSYEQVRDLFYQIDAIYQNLGQYFIRESGLLLQPDYLYYDLTTKKYYGLYYPENDVQSENSYESLMDFLIDHVDTKDQQLIDIIYQIYEMSSESYFTMADALLLFDAADDKPIETQVKDEGPWSEEKVITESSTACEKDEAPIWSEEPVFSSGEQTDRNKSRIYYGIFAALSLCGISAVIGIYFNFQLTQKELMIIVCCGAVMGLCLLFSFVQFLRQKSKIKKQENEERELRWDIEDEFRDARPIALQEVVEKAANVTGIENCSNENRLERYGETRYGETVFVDAQSQNREYKLYALDKKNKKHIELTQFPYTIGKMAGCVDCVLTDDSISRLHARFEKQEGKIFLTDMNSKNGTYKNGLRMEPSETVEIEPGDEIRFGKLNYCYR